MINPFRRRRVRRTYDELAPLQGFPEPNDASRSERTDALQRRTGDWFWRG